MSGILRVVILMATDVFTTAVVWGFAVWGYRAAGFGYYKYGVWFYLRLWPVAVAFVVLNALFRLYHGRVGRPAAPINPVEELRRLVASSLLVHLGAVAALAIARQSTEDYSRAVILIACALTALCAQPVRNLVRTLLKRLGLAQIPVVLLGEGEGVARLAAFFRDDEYTGFRVADSADVAVVSRDIRMFKTELAALAEKFTHIIFIPPGSAFPTYGGQMVSFDGAGGVEMVNQRRMKSLRIEKWLLDKGLAVVAFVCLLPFFVLVPLLVKLTSRGPVFYRQTRLGKNGRPIRVWKFRSMYVDADERLRKILESDPDRKAEWEASFKLKDDPRVTPFGRFLRKTSIDEFPQLFNVFAGDMALVGPRPIVEKEVAFYGATYETFASVEPGITGLWQASGRSDTDYARRVALDVQYVLNWSPWMDVWILFRTVGAVLFMKGAC